MPHIVDQVASGATGQYPVESVHIGSILPCAFDLSTRCHHSNQQHVILKTISRPQSHIHPPTQCHKSQSVQTSAGIMTFASTCSYTPTTEQQRDQSQRSYPHGMKLQHNNSLSVHLDKEEAHGGAGARCSLATLSATADTLPISMPPYSLSSWATSLLAANQGTLF